MISNPSQNISLILAAAGSSTRMGGGCKKEYLPLEEGTVISTALKAFLSVFTPATIVITVPQGDEENAKNALIKDSFIKDRFDSLNIQFITGGKSRQESVFNGLKALASYKTKTDIVLIHDGARPFVTEQIISDTICAASEFGASVPGLTPVDTQKLIDSQGFIQEHLQRSLMTAVQTPQGFDFTKLYNAHQKAVDDQKEYTDDTEIWGKYIGPVKVVKGDPCNIKITYPKDYKNQDSTEEKMLPKIKIGLGYDIHRLIENRKLILGGVEFEFSKGEDGHSDGDALLHAITDALLGAAGLGDIGSFFPPEEAKWKDADSKVLLQTVWKKIKAAGWQLNNLDCIVKLEKPKFLPKRQEVIDSIAQVLQVSSEQVFVKAKTGEKLDSVGNGDAVEAWCTCLLERI